jgi:predicted neuraminidase
MHRIPIATSIGALVAAASILAQPKFEAEMIFPPEAIHNHSSSIVELKDGRLMVCWYRGSGERTADDVTIEASFFEKGKWTPRITIADTPGFPDTNPVLWVDRDKRLWLFWGLVIANEWETSLLKYYRADSGKLPFNWGDSIILKPLKLAEKTEAAVAPLVQQGGKTGEQAAKLLEMAKNKYASRMGWFTRTHPIQLSSGRIIVPLYSDGYSFGLMAISDDNGKTWFGSEPIVGWGGVQPSVVARKNGELVAYMRDNGPPPKRVLMSVSKDNGLSWSFAEDTDILNSGTSLEVIALRDGRWLMVNNDTEKGRHSLLASISDDEGKTWKWNRHIEKADAGSYHYPSVIQTRDGMIHVTYSHYAPSGQPKAEGIKHAKFSVDWVMAGSK